MLLLIGTTLLCLAVLWFAVLLVGSRNPMPPWWANDWLLADIQVPMMMLLAVIGFWYIARYLAGSAPGAAASVVQLLGAVAVVATTALILRQMEIRRRLKAFDEMAADIQTDAPPADESARMLYLHRRLPWQVRLHLADTLGYDLAWIRSLRCTVRALEDRPGLQRLLAFNPEQAKSQGVVISDYDALAAHPQLILFSGVFSTDGREVAIDAEPPRRAA